MNDPTLGPKPEETNPAEELEALREEYEVIHHPGHARRRGWAELMYRSDASKLALGQITDDRLRHQAEGRCQAYKALIDRDDFIVAGWQAHLAEEEAKRQPEELEGGDYGVSYEASR